MGVPIVGQTPDTLPIEEQVRRVRVRCSRCLDVHVLEFRPLSNPTGQFAYWSSCPDLGEPVLLAAIPANALAGG